MPKYSIGIDLIKNNRIKTVLQKSYMKRFLSRVLHQQQIKFFNTIQINHGQVAFVASRWAVKQAVVKAVGIRQLIFNQLQVIKDQRGKPYLQICSQRNKQHLKKCKVDQIQISLTHQDDYSSAVAIATFKQ